MPQAGDDGLWQDAQTRRRIVSWSAKIAIPHRTQVVSAIDSCFERPMASSMTCSKSIFKSGKQV